MSSSARGLASSRLPRPSFLPVGSLPFTLLALALLAYVGWLVFVPQAPPKPDATWTRIQAEHVLRIGVDPSSPPFISDDGQGHLSGYDVALANALAARWSVHLQYVYTGYDGLYDALNGKQFDLILSALPYNPDKTEDVIFSHAYFNGGPLLILPAADTSITGLADLRGRSLAVELGSSGDAVARKSERRYALSIRRFDTAAAALGALQAGQVSAALADPIALIDFQRTASDPAVQNWRIAGKPLADDNYIVAVRKDSPTLLRELNAALDAWKLDGTLEQLQKANF